MSTGIIYVVATPLGNVEDISLRAKRILNEVDFIAAEDTRHSQRLLTYLKITTPLIAFHDFNEKKSVVKILKKISHGEKMALISDAGTPLISDPGYALIHEAHQQGINVSPIPGPSALIAALSVSGLPTDRFVFEGFLPAKSKARQERLMSLREESRTLIFYESPHRILEVVNDLEEIFGGSREVTVAKELTKIFETIYMTSVGELKNWLIADALRQKGEFVLVVKGQKSPKTVLEIYPDSVLEILQSELPLKQAVALTAKITGQNKNVLYDQALLQKKG